MVKVGTVGGGELCGDGVAAFLCRAIMPPRQRVVAMCGSDAAAPVFELGRCRAAACGGQSAGQAIRFVPRVRLHGGAQAREVRAVSAAPGLPQHLRMPSQLFERARAQVAGSGVAVENSTFHQPQRFGRAACLQQRAGVRAAEMMRRSSLGIVRRYDGEHACRFLPVPARGILAGKVPAPRADALRLRQTERVKRGADIRRRRRDAALLRGRRRVPKRKKGCRHGACAKQSRHNGQRFRTARVKDA